MAVSPSARVICGIWGMLGEIALANQPDILFPHYLPPIQCAAHGCAAWTTAPSQGPEWDAQHAGRACAIPVMLTHSARSLSLSLSRSADT